MCIEGVRMNEKNGSVIILNGISSSGKSTLAKELQSCLGNNYLHCQIDSFLKMLPNNPSLKEFPKLMAAFNQTVKVLSKTNHNVIVDVVLRGINGYSDIKNELQDIKLLIVKVDCPLEELKKRELKRGNREIGLSEKQYNDIVHDGIPYDIEVNSFKNTPLECAEKIYEYIEKNT